jgi:transcriptional regulator with XRE-family HTH domain
MSTELSEHPLRGLRRARGLTQEALSLASGVSRPTVAKIEQGAHIVQTESLRSIAHALNVPWQELCGPGQAVMARSREELAELAGDREVRCAGDSGDATAVIAAWLGQDPASPAFREYVADLHAALTAEAETA